MSVTLIMIGITALVSYLAFKNRHLLNDLLLWPAKMKDPKQLYRLLTAGFVHADSMHLIFNMVTLYFFGQILEQVLGFGLFLILYISAIVVASIPSFLKHVNNPDYLSLGASGGVAAIVFAMIYLEPWSKLYIFFAIPVPSIVFAAGYLGYTVYYAKKGGQRINHDAHLWGSLFGLLFMLVIDPTHGLYFINQLLNPVF